ncbi:helix-turn-helix domain-containing protein [Bacteroidales bacterium OttesenSCG-928-L03]|nr:helix-turn-helix domain-containing protein [Bacteroidales bacterium OttesenSCG-928-L03]
MPRSQSVARIISVLLLLVFTACNREKTTMPDSSSVYPIDELDRYKEYSETLLPDSLHIRLAQFVQEKMEAQEYELLPGAIEMLAADEIRKGDLNQAIELGNRFLDQVIQKKDSALLSESYYRVGRAFFITGTPWQAMEYFVHAAEYANSDREKSRMLYAIAHTSSLVTEQRGLDPEFYYNLSKDYAIQANDSALISQTFFGLSQVQFEALSAHHYKKTTLSPEKKDSINQSIVYLEQALSYSPTQLNVLHYALGLSHAALGDLTTAEHHIYHEWRRDGEKALMKPIYLNVLTSFEICRGDYEKALEWGQRSFRRAQELGKEDDMRNAEYIMYYACKYSGRYKEALEMFERYHERRRSLSQSAFEHQIAAFQVQHDTKIKEALLKQTVLKKESYLRLLLISISLLLLITVLFVSFLRLYRKTKRSNRLLVIKNQEWAKQLSKSLIGKEGSNGSPVNGSSSELRTKIDELFNTQKIYLDKDLSISDLARLLNTNRTYLSEEINRSGKNFNNYINEFRIKEAINLLSDPQYNHYKIEAIAYQSGFSSRNSFYQVFKKATGLSPVEFRQNLPEKETGEE